MSVIESGRLANPSITRGRLPVILRRVNKRPPEASLVRVGNGSIYEYQYTVPSYEGELIIFDDLDYPGVPEILCSVRLADGSLEYIPVLMGEGGAHILTGDSYDPYGDFRS